MKYKPGISGMIWVAILILSCDTDNKPTVPVLTTTNVTAITQTSASSGGTISDDGRAVVTDRGVCWGINSNPTIASAKTAANAGNGDFTCIITGLNANTTYYIRAYAINNVGTGYGNEVSFTTLQINAADLTMEFLIPVSDNGSKEGL